MTRKGYFMKSGLIICAFCLLFCGCAGSSEVVQVKPGGLAGVIEVKPGGFAEALEKVNPGDTLLLADGVYTGGLKLTRSGTKELPITIKAAGDGAVIDGGENCLELMGVSWVNIEGIRFQNSDGSGLRLRAMNATKDTLTEGESSTAEHIIIKNCVFANNTWLGIITSHINHLRIENCEAFGSTRSHGIYVANSGDDITLRNNIVHDNIGNGIHINGDPDCGGDGVISRALVEGNVIYENGKPRGGSAMSIMHVQDSIFRNNLLYNNYAHGFTFFWYTGDETTQSSKNNEVYHNTVYFRPGQGRFSLLMRTTSTGCTIRNNVFYGGAWGTIFVEASCLEGLDINNNAYANHPGQRLIGSSLEDEKTQIEALREAGLEVDDSDGIEVSLESWLAKGFDAKSAFDTAPEFVDIEAGNFRLTEDSIGIDMGSLLGGKVTKDIEGNSRPTGTAADCGAYEIK